MDLFRGCDKEYCILQYSLYNYKEHIFLHICTKFHLPVSTNKRVTDSLNAKVPFATLCRKWGVGSGGMRGFGGERERDSAEDVCRTNWLNRARFVIRMQSKGLEGPLLTSARNKLRFFACLEFSNWGFPEVVGAASVDGFRQ